MTAAHTVAPDAPDSSAVAPPFRPDPEIIGNLEGNDRIRERDQEAARDYLQRHHLTAPADDPTDDPADGAAPRRAS